MTGIRPFLSGIFSIFAIAIIIQAYLFVSMPETAESVEIEGRTSISVGLPQETDSFTTVEVFDSDGDGLDEMFLGGSGFRDGNIRTEGIRAYEYDPGSGVWEPFGSGLPGEGSEMFYGAIGLGDINGDGNMDITAPIPSRWYDVDFSLNGIEIYTGDGSGAFSYHHKIALDDSQLGSSNEAEIIDLDGDGNNDIVASTYTGVKVWFGDGSGTNWEESSPPHLKNTEISGIGIGDLDGDGLMDIVGTPYQRSEDIEMYVQGALRSWRDVTFKETTAGFGAKILDVNLDGNNDVVYGTHGEGIKVWLGQGDVTVAGFPCTEASIGLPDSDGEWDQIEFADVNGDDLPDMIAACNTRDTVHLFLNDLPAGWTEIFTDEESLVVGGDSYGANFGDWDGNGQIDCGACGWEDGADAWLITTIIEGENTPPIANAGSDETVYLGEIVILDGSMSRDPDGEITDWEWKCTSHASVVLQDDDGPTPSFSPDIEGEYLFTLRVMDDEEEWSGTSQVSITVIDPDVNYPPIADAGQSVSVEVGDLVTLDGSGSLDPDGEIVLYIWDCTSHTIYLEGPDTAAPSFTPSAEGDYQFTLVVEDDDGSRSGEDAVSVHVIPRSEPPDGDDDIDDKTSENISTTFLIYGGIIAAVILIAGILIFLVFRSKPVESVDTVEVVEVQAVLCPECGYEAVYNTDFNRYYCDNCRQWL
ncbi:MAG: PKD domain-containing protein [Thermoplasmatota archaeon]